MLLQELGIARIIQVFVIQLGFGGIYYLLIAYLILRRSTKRLNQIFSLYFISVALGTVVNVIYVPLFSNPAVLILHILTYYLMCFGQVFLLVFSLMLLKSERVIDTSKQMLLIVVFAGLLAGFFVIGLLGGIKIDESTGWKPVWYLPFFLYAISICVLFCLIPTFYLSLKIYRKFEDEKLKKKWRYYLIGICTYYIIWAGTSFSNFWNDDTFRFIWAIVSLFGIVSTYTIYYGVGKQI